MAVVSSKLGFSQLKTMKTNQNLSFGQAMQAAKEKCLVRRAAWPVTVHGVINIPEGEYELPLNGRNRSFKAESYNAVINQLSVNDKAMSAKPYSPTDEDKNTSDWGVLVYESLN